MMKFSTIEDLQSLIDNEIEESTVLEYKGSFGIDKENKKWKIELAKDVSAMANANGGTIIYGIRQKEGGNVHAIPSELLPIPFTEMSKDKLSQLLSSNIQPIIDNVEITVIPKDKESGFFIVNIPQSNTAHQNRLNHLYYKRRNATAEVMEDYEIRDVMNRTKYPVIELEFELHKTIKTVIEKPSILSVYQGNSEEKQYEKTSYKLKCQLVNKGRMYAKYINYFIHIPLQLNSRKEPFDIDDSGDYYNLFGDNTVRDIIGTNGHNSEYGPKRYDPLLPGISMPAREIELNYENIKTNEKLPAIWYSISADNAPERIITVEWDKIKTFVHTKTEIKDPNKF